MSKRTAPTRPAKPSPQAIASIASLQSKPLRRLLSGMLARKPDEVRLADLKKIIRVAPTSDLFGVGLVIGSSHLADFKNYIPGNPTTMKELFWNPAIFSEPLIREVELQLGFIATQIPEIKSSLSKLKNIDDLLEPNNEELCKCAIIDFVSEHGHSLAIIRKSLLLRNINGEIQNPIMDELMGQKPDSISYTYFYICDAIFSASNYYIDTAQQWSSFCESNIENSSKTLTQMLFCPIAADEAQLARYLRASGNASAIDLAIAIISNQDAFSAERAINKQLSPQARTTLDELIDSTPHQPGQPPAIISRYTARSKDDNDAYRYALAFPEYQSVARWRGAIDYHYGARMFRFHRQAASPLQVGDNYFPRSLTLKSLTGKGAADSFQLQRYENTQATTFLRTAATLCALDRGEHLWDLPQPRLMDLLGQTEGLSRLLTLDEIKKVHDGACARNELMIAFLSLIMLNQKSPSADLDYELRESFQTLMDEWFQSNLVQFLDWVYRTTPELIEAVIEVLNTEFLQKLYSLCTTMDEALQCRQKICEWAFDATGNEAYSIMSKRLSQDRAIGEASKTIDSSRIYVVQSDFNSWCERYISPYLEQYRQLNIRNTDAEDVIPNPSQSHISTKSELASESGPLYYLVRAALLAHQEFCTNPVYGINAYLSRRIRHGTLLGFLEKPIWEIVREYEQLCKSEGRCIDPAILHFRDRYSETLIELRDAYIQLATPATPNGLFSLHPINTARKRDWLTSFLRLTDQNIQSGAPLREISKSFFEYCWGVVDFDLARVRALCADYRRRISVDLIARMAREKSDTSNAFVSLENHLREVVAEKFSDFEKWFTKPPDVFVTAPFDILCRVVERHAARFSKQHTGKLVLAGDLSFTLAGQGYHDMYDILLALLGNAARHGRADGDVTISAALRSVDSHKPTGTAVLEVHVSSLLPAKVKEDKLLSLFSEEARKNHDASKGATEGDSGIPKTWATLDRNRIPSNIDVGKRLEATIANGKLIVTVRYISVVTG